MNYHAVGAQEPHCLLAADTRSQVVELSTTWTPETLPHGLCDICLSPALVVREGSEEPLPEEGTWSVGLSWSEGSTW